MKQILSFSSLLLVMFFTACKKDITPEYFNRLNLPQSASAVTSGQNTFALNVFNEQMAIDGAKDNKLISPLSIYLCLAMVYNGSDGQTKAAIEQALSMQGTTIDNVNEVCKAFITQLPNEDSKVKLSIANSVWYNKNHSAPLPAFLNVTSEYYKAKTSALDFAGASAVGTINKWVYDNTNGKIEKIISSISSDEVMFLINAIYFNGKWKNAFKASETKNDAFYVTNAPALSVPFMTGTFNTYYKETDHYRIAELPYGSGKGFSMYVLIPKNTSQTLSNFVSQIDKTNLGNQLSDTTKTSLTISIPKWEYSYSIDNMKDALSRLGMGIAFTTAADFTKMYTSSANISRVVHKTYIKVYEEGTEAAAVTSTGMVTTSAPTPLLFKLNRPFTYLIVEKQSGSILFMGTVDNPSKH